VKVGDLVTFKNLSGWPPLGLVTQIHITNAGTGQIHLLLSSSCGSTQATIPWVTRDRYIVEARREDR